MHKYSDEVKDWARYKVGMGLAASEVCKAVRRGDLLPVTDFSCVDCGKPAKNYEHRDYNKPLDVVPVCRSCNRFRGAGISLFIVKKKHEKKFNNFCRIKQQKNDKSRLKELELEIFLCKLNLMRSEKTLTILLEEELDIKVNLMNGKY